MPVWFWLKVDAGANVYSKKDEERTPWDRKQHTLGFCGMLNFKYCFGHA